MRVCVLCAQEGGKRFCDAKVCVVAAMVSYGGGEKKLVALIFSFASVTIK